MPASRSTARRYAEAAFQIAERDGTVAEWLVAFEASEELLSRPDLVRVLANPAIPTPARREILERAAGDRITGAPLRLLLLLTERGRIERLPDVAREFRRLHAQREGIVEAAITSAAPLSADELEQLRQRLVALTGSGRIEISVDVDPGLLGGVQVRLGDRLIDGSVRGRLERLRTKLASGAL